MYRGYDCVFMNILSDIALYEMYLFIMNIVMDIDIVMDMLWILNANRTPIL